MDLFTPGHIALVVIGALLLFGPKRLPEIGKSLGKGLREFREAMTHAEDEAKTAPAAEASTVIAAPSPPAPAAAPPVPAPAPVEIPVAEVPLPSTNGSAPADREP
jgi:sec-independent protein translocase protein TatA